MGRYPQLDAACRSACPALSVRSVAAVLLFCLPLCAQSASSGSPQSSVETIRRLYQAGHWRQVVRDVPATPDQPPQLALYRGLALAQLGQLAAAERQFRMAAAAYPRDARFPVELAGIAYRQKKFSVAIADLRHALHLRPSDDYANNFLGSIYYLQGNLEAALKYWNRADKPRLNDLSYNVDPDVPPLLLDRAFAFSRGSVWRLRQFRTTQARLAGLDLFSQMRFDLDERQDGQFNLGFTGAERSRGTRFTVSSAASFLRGLPYQSVYPELYNLNRDGLNWLSFVRWDDEKRWLSTEIAAPLPEGPQKRFRLNFVGRNENWDVARTLQPGTESVAGFNMERAVLGGEIESIVSGQWQWTVGAKYSYRRFRTLFGIPAPTSPLFTDASAIALTSSVQHPLLQVPEHRFTLDSAATGEFGTFYSNPLGRYGRLNGTLAATWFPQAQGDDYRTRTMLRAGGDLGQVSFDDLYMLGFDRDNPLWMRGHNGLVNGEKGNAPLGTRYVLSNSQVDKIAYHAPFTTLRVGPFLDTGEIFDSSGYFGSRQWLVDTGVQARVGVLGSFAFIVGYGRDLRSGANTFYSTVTR
jgi:tetratricopeptide (TPR) repeat protein